MRPALIHSVILIAVLCPACPDLLLSRAAAQTAATDPTIPQTHDNDSTTASAAPEAIRQFELQIRPLLADRKSVV